MWIKVLCKKYGTDIVSNQNLEAESRNRFESLWWKDVRLLGREVQQDVN
jgi:hypothetical protein